jgi:hypothetical protein
LALQRTALGLFSLVRHSANRALVRDYLD